MNDFALMITMDAEGRLFIEAIVPADLCTPIDKERTQVRMPLPRLIIPTLARAMLDTMAIDPDLPERPN